MSTRALTSSICTYVESVLITGCLAIFDALYSSYEQLLWMRLQMEEIVCAQRVEQSLESRGIWTVEEEFLPKTFRLFYLFLFLA
jgi:hypothetical protein